MVYTVQLYYNAWCKKHKNTQHSHFKVMPTAVDVLIATWLWFSGNQLLQRACSIKFILTTLQSCCHHAVPACTVLMWYLCYYMYLTIVVVRNCEVQWLLEGKQREGMLGSYHMLHVRQLLFWDTILASKRLSCMSIHNVIQASSKHDPHFNIPVRL